MTLLCFESENGFKSDLISFTIWRQRGQQILFEGEEKKTEGVESGFLYSPNGVLAWKINNGLILICFVWWLTEQWVLLNAWI